MGGVVTARMLRRLAGAAVAAVALLAIAGPRDAAAAPNILMIVTDDQPSLQTMQAMPNTTRWFFDGGTRFTRAHATTPLCCPSRSSILTGRYAHNHGQYFNVGSTELDPATTIARYLHDAGYRTGIVGKYLNTWPLNQAPPYFDDHEIFTGGYYKTRWNLNGLATAVSDYSTTFIARESVDFIEKAESEDSRPWFLYVAVSAPHKPWVPEHKYATSHVGPFPTDPARNETDLTDKPAWYQEFLDRFPTDPNARVTVREQQLRTLRSVDDMVAAIHAAEIGAGEKTATLSFFMSDNGLFWGEHGAPAIKDLPYLASTRIPMAMNWPGHVPAGKVDGRLTANIDIAPTIAAAVGGIVPSPAMDGRNLLDSGWKRNRLLLEYFGIPDAVPPWASEITPTYQYTLYRAFRGFPAEREYYDLSADPWELTNVLGDAKPGNDLSAARIAALDQQLFADLSCTGAQCP